MNNLKMNIRISKIQINNTNIGEARLPLSLIPRERYVKMGYINGRKFSKLMMNGDKHCKSCAEKK